MLRQFSRETRHLRRQGGGRTGPHRVGCRTYLMGDSENMKLWPHRTVLARIIANGGKIPKELLD